MGSYKINHAMASATSDVIMPNWQTVSPLFINTFPWYISGNKQKTAIKLCANSKGLFIHIVAEDRYSSSEQIELNHMLICEDSCVEFFFSPSGILGSNYINLEVNCCGTMHIAYGSNRENRQFMSQDIAKNIQCQPSISSLKKQESSEDTQWVVDIYLPFSAIEMLTGEKVNPNKWFANFYRCGGKTEPQYASWQNIPTTTPDFHQPDYFGELIFTSPL